MFYTPKNDFTNFATMKKIALFVFLLLIAVISFGQTVPVQAKTLRVNWGSDNYSINLNGDSVLIDASDFIWFAKKFGSDTLLFGDGTYMTTVPTGYVHDTGDTITGNYRFTYTGGGGPLNMDWAGGALSFYGSGSTAYANRSGFQVLGPMSTTTSALIYEGLFLTDNSVQSSLKYNELSISDSGYTVTSSIAQPLMYFSYDDQSTTVYNKLIVSSPTSNDEIINMNNLKIGCDSTVKADDASIVLTSGMYGWGEVYAFNAGAIDEWAEFIISTDGTVYLKSNSTDVVNTDTDNKLCIFDNGSGVTIRNRLGGTRTIKYIIHH